MTVHSRSNSYRPVPTPAQLRWQDYEIGLLYHFDLSTYRDDGSDHAVRRAPVDPARFTPVSLDTDQWLEAAVAAGAKYAMFTASHETGFANWQSDLYQYGVKHVAWGNGKRDIVGEFVASCRKYGIAPGLFIGLRFNLYKNVSSYLVQNGSADEQKAYIEVCERQVEELCSRYGALDEIWIEGGALAPDEGGPDILPIVERHQPDTVFYHSPQRGDHRWVGNEKGVAGYPCWATMPHRGGRTVHGTQEYASLLANGDPDALYWSPAMCDVPIRDHRWFWHPGEDHLVYGLDDLVEMYDKSVGRNGVLTIGAVPDRNGLIPEADFARYAEFGREIHRRFSTPIAAGSGSGSTVELVLPEPARIDQIVIQEDIALGERIRAYRVEGKTGTEWETLCEGVSIAHKRIQRFDATEVAAIRLACMEYVAEPRIRNLAVYHIG